MLPNRPNKPSPFEEIYFSKGPNTILQHNSTAKPAPPLGNRKTRRSSRFKRNNENTRTANVPLFKGPYTISKTNFTEGKAFIDEIIDMPIFLIAAHACICPQKGECFGDNIPFAFSVPQDTYIMSFSQPGDYCTVNDIHLYKNADAIKAYLWHHSESDIIYGNRVGKNRFSVFSGIRRATGAPPDFGKEIFYPNIAFTMNEYKTGINGKRKLVEQAQNPYGVYDISDPPPVNWSSFSFNNTMSICPQNGKRSNWMLQDIIKEVYTARGITKGIFLLTGCFDRCDDKYPYENIDAAAAIIQEANNEYVNLKPIMTKEELESISQYIVRNEGINKPLTVLSPSEVRNMKKRGVTDPKVYKTMKKLFNKTNHDEIEKIMGTKFTNP